MTLRGPMSPHLCVTTCPHLIVLASILSLISVWTEPFRSLLPPATFSMEKKKTSTVGIFMLRSRKYAVTMTKDQQYQALASPPSCHSALQSVGHASEGVLQ